MKNNSAAIVEVVRGDFVESTHEVDIVVADAAGTIVSSYGKSDIHIFPRSANKSLQALPLIESGAADAFGFEEKHLALACSSHNGQPMHVEAASEMLQKAGLDGTCLECGAQLPKRSQDQSLLVQEGIEIAAIHNNCSGKHSGFLAFAKHTGLETAGYIHFDHPVQKEIAGVLETVTSAKHGKDNYAIDGCSIPTFKIPLQNLAIAYARFGVGEDASSQRAKAMLRLRDACLKHPEMVAGDERVCTQLMKTLGNRAFVKVGAEGVYTLSLPELGLGAAMKARDGNFRAVEVAVSQLCCDLLKLDEQAKGEMKSLTNPVLTNWNGFEVGSMRMA
jgi:L-asparaginase II